MDEFFEPEEPIPQQKIIEPSRQRQSSRNYHQIEIEDGASTSAPTTTRRSNRLSRTFNQKEQEELGLDVNEQEFNEMPGHNVGGAARRGVKRKKGLFFRGVDFNETFEVRIVKSFL